MPEVLSQAEIDSLLTAVSSGQIDSDAASSSETEGKRTVSENQLNWIAYDLTSHEKIARGRLVALESIHERFSRLFRASLSTHLKRQVSVNLAQLDFMKFSDYLQNLILPTSVNILNMTQLKGSLLFVVTSKLTYALVDAYYGGTERPFSKVGNRDEFTSIENNMISKITALAVKDLQEAWRLNYPLGLKFNRTETNPYFIGTIHPSELVAVLAIDVEFESLIGTCFVVLQLEPLEKIQEHLAFNVTGDFSLDNKEWKEHWEREILKTELEMRVELGSAYRSLSEIKQFKPGTELVLGQDSLGPLRVFVQDSPLLEGIMGNVRGNIAVKITKTLQNDENEGEDNELLKVANG